MTILSDEDDFEDVEEIRLSLVTNHLNIRVNQFFNFLSIITIGCNENDLRLVGGADRAQGRVEMCFQQRWGSVCSDSWDNQAAAVVCRQLGLTNECESKIDLYDHITTCLVHTCTCTAASAYRNLYNVAPFGTSGGQTVLSNVMCVGNESTLLDCSVFLSSNLICRDFQTNAGVDCIGRTQRK